MDRQLRMTLWPPRRRCVLIQVLILGPLRPLFLSSADAATAPASLVYSTRRIERSKSVGAGYVPNQQPPTFPSDQSDAIRTFSIHAIEARWFQAGWYFCCSKSPAHNVVQCDMTVMVNLAPTTVKPMCGETVHPQTAMILLSSISRLRSLALL